MPLARSVASSAAPSSTAIASARATSSAMASTSGRLTVTDPEAIPSGTSTIATTDTAVATVSPLVVSIVRAQRRFATLWLRTSTMHPREVEAASARSTISCGVLIGLPPARC